MPLMEAQEGLWFAQALDPANPIFNTCHYFDLGGALDVEAFTQSVNRAFAEADSLALRFEEAGGTVL